MSLLSRLLGRAHIDASWTLDGEQADKKVEQRGKIEYVPLSDTLRLYAGWLLAWYFLIYCIGAYQYTRPLPWQSALLDQLFSSPLILHFSFLAFLYLLGTELHKLFGRRVLVGMVIAILGAGLYVLFRANA